MLSLYNEVFLNQNLSRNSKIAEISHKNVFERQYNVISEWYKFQLTAHRLGVTNYIRLVWFSYIIVSDNHFWITQFYTNCSSHHLKFLPSFARTNAWNYTEWNVLMLSTQTITAAHLYTTEAMISMNTLKCDANDHSKGKAQNHRCKVL